MNPKLHFAPKALTFSSPAMPTLRGGPALEAVFIYGSEEISKLPRYIVRLQTPELDPGLGVYDEETASVNYKALVGKDCTVSIELEGHGFFVAGLPGGAASNVGAGRRMICGLVTQARYVSTENRRSQYECVIEPWPVLMQRNRDARTYQDKTVVEILKLLFDRYNYPVDIRCSQQYPKLTWQVQYLESDFSAFQRLAAEWGLYWYIEHGSGKESGTTLDAAHRLVVVDGAGGHKPNPSAAYHTVNFYPPHGRVDEEHIRHYTNSEEIRSGQWATDDYDFRHSRAPLGKVQTMRRNTGNNAAEQFDWPGDYTKDEFDAGTAHWLSRVRMEAEGVQGITGTGRGNLRGMVTGCTFRLGKHTRAQFNGEYLITGTRLFIHQQGLGGQGTQAPDAWQDLGDWFKLLNTEDATGPGLAPNGKWLCHCEFTTIPANNQFRAQWPRDDLGRLLKPRIEGTQTGIVTGPKGKDVWVNEHGQVKVHFWWDRHGTLDEQASCWIRVSNFWSGGELGSTHVPRIGQEVILSFENGDPDRPLIIGQVNNQMNMASWQLPGQHALSGIRSRMLGGFGNSPAGPGNHFLMDDTEDQLQLQCKSDHLHSQTSMGYITRVEDNKGRKDFRGEGVEVRTDGHGVIRAAAGLLISAESRSGAASHMLDMDETTARLAQASGQLESAAHSAESATAQHSGADQAEVAQALKAQNEGITGTTAAKGKFPELAQPHIVVASPAGIATTTPGTTHIASGAHVAINAGKHTSISALKKVLVSAVEGIRIFTARAGMKLIAASGKIDVQAQSDAMALLAKLGIEITSVEGDVVIKARGNIVLEAGKKVQVNGAGSYSQWTAGGITHGTMGDCVHHAQDHIFDKPAAITVGKMEIKPPVSTWSVSG